MKSWDVLRSMKEGYSKVLRTEADPLWMKIFKHPFLIEIGEGSLPRYKFRFYVEQDYAYLVEFARCLGIAAAKAEDRETVKTLASLLNASLTVEVEMLEDIGERIGIKAQELHASTLAPTNYAYTRHLLYVAYSGTLGETMSALLPCMWTYQEIGEKLSSHMSREGADGTPVYHEWLSTYLSQEYVDLVYWYRRIVDAHASKGGTSTIEKMRRHFISSSRYEYLFWEMAYSMESWPV